jgi:hypothetical protein
MGRGARRLDGRQGQRPDSGWVDGGQGWRLGSGRVNRESGQVNGESGRVNGSQGQQPGSGWVNGESGGLGDVWWDGGQLLWRNLRQCSC